MKIRECLLKSSAVATLIILLSSCTKDGYIPNPDGLLKKVKSGDYITEEISYNNNNLVIEVNSTTSYRRFHYDQDLNLIKQEVSISPMLFSSSLPANTHEFVDPEKTGITMYYLYEYNKNGRLSRQLNYFPKDGDDELRSIRTFEYNDNNLISKEFLHNSDDEVTQFRTYAYDFNGNVIEEDYYSYLFIPVGSEPKHLSKITYEYDIFYNPYKIFENTCNPGINTNRNNIIKTKTTNYEPSPGVPASSETETSYEYNFKTGYPFKVIDGEEFIYE